MSWNEIGEEVEPKQAQLMATLQWVECNYEWSEGVCVPRCLLYQHYQDFCSGTGFVSVGPATFGKIIRQRFPKLTTRRLGTRGQSRYHYYGIGIKVTSPYYTHNYTGSGLSKFSRVAVKTHCLWSAEGDPDGEEGSLLPLFPQLEDLNLKDAKVDLINTFLVMYRNHWQRVLDAIVAAAFHEVENLLLHFWNSLPPHVLAVLQDQSVATLVAVCDHNLYRVLTDLLLPNSFRDMPDSLLREMTSFATHLPGWVGVALSSSPAPLLQAKGKVCAWFVTSLKRHLSFIRLARISSEVLGTKSRSMASDLSSLSMTTICRQLASVCRPVHHQLILKHFEALVSLLMKAAPFEEYIDWMDHLLHQHLLQSCANPVPVCACGRRFLLTWTYLVSLITRQLTLSAAPSFGALHVLEVCVSEYVHLVVESERISELAQRDRIQALRHSLKPGSRFWRWLIGQPTSSHAHSSRALPEVEHSVATAVDEESSGMEPGEVDGVEEHLEVEPNVFYRDNSNYFAQ